MGLSTEAGVPFKEDEYPPLPDYKSPQESRSKEVFIVRVRGIPWSSTPEDLLNFFSECRIRDGVNGIHLTLTRTGKPNGQAFIELEHEEDVHKALEKHRQYLGPRYVEVYEVTNSEAEEILRTSSLHPAQDGVIRIRGLPYICTEEDVVRFFSGLEIVAGGVTIVRDRWGRNTGIAYVEFASQEMADQALERDRGVIGNRYIEVFPSRKMDILSQHSKRRAEYASPPDSRPLPEANKSEPAAQPRPEPENSTCTAAPVSASRPVSSAPAYCVHIRGLPFQTNGHDIVNFFAPLRLERILIEYGPDGRATGEADVYFTCHEDAVAAMSRDKANMQERYLELFLNSASPMS
ncbi:hypothetical protein MATL_G00065770 [Megalops atlanticus]|uniref:RRM domain-containing protein n=1 Tax=Megalops atlanticus TaxID=7932 RepID=A0A9D3QBG6_MEGAT|nr:hypothetical protein MATL_G00065770 [Megalops atlanticus]